MAETKPKATLELFSGTGSFTKTAREMLGDTHAAFLSLDNDSFFSDNTTFTCDILEFQYMARSFHLISLPMCGQAAHALNTPLLGLKQKHLVILLEQTVWWDRH